MSSEYVNQDSPLGTAEEFYAAYLRLPDNERESFLIQLFNNLSSSAIAVTLSGAILSEKLYEAHVESISKEVKEGRFISHEAILKEME